MLRHVNVSVLSVKLSAVLALYHRLVPIFIHHNIHLLFNRTAFIEETLEHILNRFCYGLIIKYCREGNRLWSVLNGEIVKLDSRATFVYSGSLLQTPFLEASD